MSGHDDSTWPRWVADIGGTNARFAWAPGPGAPLTDDATYPCAEHATLEAAMRHYLAEHGKAVPRWCAIGIATPVTGDQVRMTNHHWAFSIETVRTSLGLERLEVINDFTALALSLSTLQPGELRQIGGGTPAAGAAIALIGPGTGLGVSGLLPVAGSSRYVPISGEGGHVTLSAADAFEAQVVERLRARFGHASAERAICGPGLQNLLRAICEIEARPVEELSAAQIAERGLADAASPCGRTLDLFFSLLGTAAGNLALTLGARGGVYIGGGIVPRLGDAIERSRFHERFLAKGRYRDYLSPIPVWVIDAQTSPALRGALRALEG
jgi:glucokinase